MSVLTPLWERSWQTMQAESEKKNITSSGFFPQNHITYSSSGNSRTLVWRLKCGTFSFLISFTVFCTSASEGYVLLSDCDCDEKYCGWHNISLLFITFLVSVKTNSVCFLCFCLVLTCSVSFLNPWSSSRREKKKCFVVLNGARQPNINF